MRKLIFTSTLLALSLCFSLTASAQDGPRPEVGVEEGEAREGVVYESETTYDFENDIVEGQLVRPDGEFISGQRHGKQSSLVHIRSDFVEELVRSVEEL